MENLLKREKQIKLQRLILQCKSYIEIDEARLNVLQYKLIKRLQYQTEQRILFRKRVLQRIQSRYLNGKGDVNPL